jgi:hypothetical protein
MANHYKPKSASAPYSKARLILLSEPWLKYKEVHHRMATTCQVGTVEVYGASIRHEIGCELKSRGGKETLFIDYDKYVAACNKYGVPAWDAEVLTTKSTLTRKVEVIQQLPQPPEVIVVTETFSLGGDIKSKKDRINKAFQDAEIKMSFASHEAIHLEAERKELMEKVAEIDAKIAKWRQEIDEAQQAMDVLLSLVDAPDAVIDMVL